MPRRARIVIPGLPHHITQRGNNRERVFREPEDYATYCRLANRFSEKYGMAVVAYCLMPNHVHFVAVPSLDCTLARTLNTLHMKYSQYFNSRMRRSGHLWQGRFYSCPLDDEHLFRAMRYVERNPVRANLAKRPWDYAWSSARARTGSGSSPIHLHNTPIIGSRPQWKDYLQQSDDLLDSNIRRSTHKGVPVGTDLFIRTLEERLSIQITRRGPGRPRKQK